MNTTTTKAETIPMFIRCRLDILHDMKRIAAEKEARLTEIAVEAWSQYIQRNKQLLSQKVTLSSKNEVLLEQHPTVPSQGTDRLPTKHIDR